MRESIDWQAHYVTRVCIQLIRWEIKGGDGGERESRTAGRGENGWLIDGTIGAINVCVSPTMHRLVERLF